MKKEIGIVLTLCLIVSVSLILVGCKRQKIEFKTQSKFQKTMNKIKTNSSLNNAYEAKTSKGVVIYKDKRYSTQGSGVNFGPNDINFDLNIK